VTDVLPIVAAAAALDPPFAFADVGSRWGPTERWREFGTAVKIVGFDADAEECRRLQAELDPDRRNLTFVPVALGARRGPAVLHVTQEPACSSLYPPDEDVIAAFPELQVTTLVKRVPIELETLDSWCEEHDVVFHAMKLDVQGSELDVLRGAEEQLRHTVMLEVEVEFNPIYRGVPLFGDVDGFLRGHGFSLWRLGQLVHYAHRGVDRETVIPDLQAFDSRPVCFDAGPGQISWANAWYVADDVLRGDDPARRLRGALAAVGFGFADLAQLLSDPV
jgi:FkbM family methyltransferase